MSAYREIKYMFNMKVWSYLQLINFKLSILRQKH